MVDSFTVSNWEDWFDLQMVFLGYLNKVGYCQNYKREDTSFFIVRKSSAVHIFN